MRRCRPAPSPSGPAPSRRRRALLLAALSLLATTALPAATAYVTSGLPAHTHRAFLRKLTDELCDADPGTLSPMEVANAPMLMEAWATAPEKRKERAAAMEGLLKRMVEEQEAGNEGASVTTDEYNAVLRGWATSGEKGRAAERAEQIVRQMQDAYASGDSSVQPDAASFDAALEAWLHATDEPRALSRAQNILEWRTKLHLSKANDRAAPQTSSFYPLLKCWAASDSLEAPLMAEKLVRWMQHLQTEKGLHAARPDTMCFNIVLSAWLKSKDVTSEKRIRQIFEYMDKCRRNGNTDMKPDASTYNIVISSIGPAVKEHHEMGGARRADKILARLEKGYLAGDTALRPDTIVYNQVIDYWAKAQSIRGHFLRAREVLDRQVAMHDAGGVRQCRPDVTGYTSVVAACASTYGSKLERRRAFDVAHATFMEACKSEHARPNDVTYGLMFKAVGRLLPKEEERDRYARTLFGLCIDDGHLGEMAYKRMKEAVSEELLLELTNGQEYWDFEWAWKRNVGGQRRMPEKKVAAKKGELRP